MTGISFFTPVQYSNGPQNLGETLLVLADNYFSPFDSNVAIALPRVTNGSQEVTLAKGNPLWWQTALKILSYATVILPLLLFVTKAVLRSTYRFHTYSQPSPIPHR